ncbi:amidohydrolase family protein [Sphingobium nicotianae]|uniref:Amidohydrolase family protein n=1 Tax=Sphingobium nicotianae TaxID=2782607 RepID=A0A9X1DD61_9SPHN|nr:amidohydrolase family protein [Sphingobium nicotianae]MBT2187871.1 amidohydrolase family protein [Sphingobium nicotianae]
MKLNHPLISCDDHLDLNMLPADLWTKGLPEHLRDRAPHIEVIDGRPQWVCEGKSWGGWNGQAGPDTGPKAIFTAFDRGGITDLTERRPAVPELRIADMDRDGVYGHVIYGPVTSINLADTEFRDACYRVYNDWLADYCAYNPNRLIGVPMLPEYPESAVQELYRIAKMGVFKQANLQIAAAETGLHDERWEPLWNALEETGIILSFHVVVFIMPGSKPNPAAGKVAGHMTHAKSFVSQFIDPFVDLFAWAILERHPKLKVVIAESGVGWLPWLVEELDYRHWRIWEGREFWETRGGIPMITKPSELFKRQVYATFQESPTAMSLLKFYGPDNLLWASDYPHPDSIWPNSRATIARQMADLPDETIRKLTFENAAKLYGLNVAAMEAENEQIAAE